MELKTCLAHKRSVDISFYCYKTKERQPRSHLVWWGINNIFSFSSSAFSDPTLLTSESTPPPIPPPPTLRIFSENV